MHGTCTKVDKTTELSAFLRTAALLNNYNFGDFNGLQEEQVTQLLIRRVSMHFVYLHKDTYLHVMLLEEIAVYTRLLCARHSYLCTLDPTKSSLPSLAQS